WPRIRGPLLTRSARRPDGGGVPPGAPASRRTAARQRLTPFRPAVLNHREDIDGRAIEQVDGEEVGSQDGFCLGAQELAPRRPGPARRRVEPRLLQRLPHGRGRDADAKAGQLTVNPAVAPPRILA